jgi:DNA-binding transcriptional ArsR family regulator
VTQDPYGGQYQLPASRSVASIFPVSTERVTPTPTNREIVEVADDRADALFEALGSGTAREILAQLLQEPRTASELTEEMDTSLQNIHYHLKKLDDAEAIEEVAVEYSSRGREMSVYAATCRPQILAYDLE